MCKFNPVRPVGMVAMNGAGESQGETGLTTASGACYRDQPRRKKAVPNFCKLTLTPDKAGRRGWKGGPVTAWCCALTLNWVHNRCSASCHIRRTGTSTFAPERSPRSACRHATPSRMGRQGVAIGGPASATYKGSEAFLDNWKGFCGEISPT